MVILLELEDIHTQNQERWTRLRTFFPGDPRQLSSHDGPVTHCSCNGSLAFRTAFQVSPSVTNVLDKSSSSLIDVLPCWQLHFRPVLVDAAQSISSLRWASVLRRCRPSSITPRDLWLTCYLLSAREVNGNVLDSQLVFSCQSRPAVTLAFIPNTWWISAHRVWWMCLPTDTRKRFLCIENGMRSLSLVVFNLSAIYLSVQLANHLSKYGIFLKFDHEIHL